jgi:hypothetical protein
VPEVLAAIRWRSFAFEEHAMRQTTIALLMLLGVTISTAEGGLINANNGKLPGAIGWDNVHPGDTLSILVTLTRESGDPAQVAAADVGLSVTGPGSSLPTIASADGTTALDMNGSGLLLAGGALSGVTGKGTSTVTSTVNMAAPYPSFTSLSAYQLFRCDVTVPTSASSGLYLLSFDTASTDVIDNYGDPISLSTINGTINVVPEPATFVALASLLLSGAAVWGGRRWRRARSDNNDAPEDGWRLGTSWNPADLPREERRSIRRQLRSS